MMDVRRLAAIDMYGGSGRPWRRWVIVGEFVFGVAALLAIGTLTLVNAKSPLWWIVGAWLIGVGLNYVPLMIHAYSLSPPGALAAELDGLDAKAEISRYNVRQAWILVPLAVVVMAVPQWLSRRRAAA